MGRGEGGGTGRTEGGGGCERMGSEEAMLGIDESILCNKVQSVAKDCEAESVIYWVEFYDDQLQIVNEDDFG